MKRIMLVDDHDLILDGFSAYFSSKDDLEVIKRCSSAKEAVGYCDVINIDLILMDVCTIENESGIEACQTIKENHPEIKVIVMSGFDDISYIPRCKVAKADAFLHKGNSMEKFKEVVELVLNGKKYFPEVKSIPVLSGEKNLSKREIEVLRMLCKQKSRVEIAEDLCISHRTVDHHIENLLRKTGARNTLALVAIITSDGWIKLKY